MQLDWHLKIADFDVFKETVEAAVDQDVQNVNTFCFFCPETSSIIGLKNCEKDISELFKGCGNMCYEVCYSFLYSFLV